MSEENKKAEQTEQEVKTAELSEQDLGEVAGGTAGEDPLKGLNVTKSKPVKPGA
jgi:hypothetical protein